MESIFLLQDEDDDQADRATILQHIVHTFGCTYICLWSYLPQPSNWLISMDGYYDEAQSSRPSSSSGSHASRLFDEYRQTVFSVENDRVPGLAFKNSLPFMELKGLELQGLASSEVQLQFYQEARIKAAVFMGCTAGEIELGMSNDPPANFEAEMRKYWFPEDLSPPEPLRSGQVPHWPDKYPHSSSSSSLMSVLSMESPDCSPLFSNIIPSTSNAPEPPKDLAPTDQASRSLLSTSTSPLHEAMQAYSNQTRNVALPRPEDEQAAITEALLAVLSSSSPPSSTVSALQHQHMPSNYPLSQDAGAFKRFRLSLAPSTARGQRSQNMVKKAITFYKELSSDRADPQPGQGSRPTSTQLHHVMSERKRREKLNESFQALRSLLPPGTKKDKASVLSSTTEYLGGLKAQVEELTRRNQILEAQLLPKKEETEEVVNLSSNESVGVEVRHVAESTHEARIIDLQVTLRAAGEGKLADLVIRILEFLKQVKNVGLMSVEAADTMAVLRLKIEGDEWDEAAFQEAVRRVVG